jgi:hypothetical protein
MKSNRDNDIRKPRGRQKGSKNKATILREAINGDFERSLKRNFKDIMAQIIKQAKEGCTQSQKLLFDKVIANARTEEESKVKDMGIIINISDMSPKRVVQEVIERNDIEGEFSEIQEKSCDCIQWVWTGKKGENNDERYGFCGLNNDNKIK